MAGQGFGSWGHLAARFLGALSPAGPPAGDEAWARGALLPGEVALWERMSGPDRRHAVGVARQTEVLLGGAPAREVLAAALLHDVGKLDADLGTWARVATTLAALAAGRDRLVAWAGRGRRGSRRARVGAYLVHDRLGRELLEAAGSHPLTAAWAGEHHLPEPRWSVPAPVGAALKAADGD